MQSKPFRRVLVIAYYFPPMGLSGVQRVTKLVKYLPDNGWHPTVLTVDPGAYFAFDQSLLSQLADPRITIERTASWDPTHWFGKKQATVRLPEEARRHRLSSISQWVFIPDNKIGWYPFAVQRGKSLLDAQSFDAIYVSAPPYSSLLIARRLSHYARIPFICDFRDDWVGNPRHVYPTRLHRRLHQWMERRVLSDAAGVTSINTAISAALETRNHAEIKHEVATLPQGYDQDDFDQVAVHREEMIEPDASRCTFLYTGVFYDAQKPDDFLHGLAQAIKQHDIPRHQIRARFAGLVPRYFDELVSQLSLGDIVEYTGYVDHPVAIAHLMAADVLWLTIGERPGAETISTGKLYEYMGARKPILALVPEGTAREALLPYDAATIVSPHDRNRISAAIIDLWEAWREHDLPQANDAYASQFDREVLARRTVDLLERSVEPSSL